MARSDEIHHRESNEGQGFGDPRRRRGPPEMGRREREGALTLLSHGGLERRFSCRQRSSDTRSLASDHSSVTSLIPARRAVKGRAKKAAEIEECAESNSCRPLFSFKKLGVEGPRRERERAKERSSSCCSLSQQQQRRQPPRLSIFLDRSLKCRRRYSFGGKKLENKTTAPLHLKSGGG